MSVAIPLLKLEEYVKYFESQNYFARFHTHFSLQKLSQMLLKLHKKGSCMRIILATTNQGKIKEIKAYLKGWDVKSFDEITTPFEIEESGKTFKENALIKARALYGFLKDLDGVVLADDSGISLPILNGDPGIHSARYSGKNAKAIDNTKKLIQTLKDKNIKKTPAFYTACMAIATKWGDFTAHGYMHGFAIDEMRGKRGFGYDPMFIPLGEDRTLAQMDEGEKLAISHRSKALDFAKIILKSLPKE